MSKAYLSLVLFPLVHERMFMVKEEARGVGKDPRCQMLETQAGVLGKGVYQSSAPASSPASEESRASRTEASFQSTQQHMLIEYTESVLRTFSTVETVSVRAEPPRSALRCPRHLHAYPQRHRRQAPGSGRRQAEHAGVGRGFLTAVRTQEPACWRTGESQQGAPLRRVHQ